MAKSTQKGGFTAKKAYLILYNAASAVAWLTVLGRVVATIGYKGTWFVPLVVDNFARITQTFAVMEVLHALTGVVPAPVFTTAMQVASRLFLMWAITYPFPQLNTSVFYSSMLIAWATTEVIRYTYFVFKQIDSVPAWLHWLRYSAFLVLYPLGISSEVAMTLLALFGPAQEFVLGWYPYALGAVLLSYIPGSVVLYSHMLKQRRKYLGAGANKKSQ
ncbi:hypothetical protein QBC35DRAFT_459674 [Podospora australis]|uniref:Very-long-chain (3R)-3-hydroxyacyl-CoA dehydratase n=1 Tax=Podospora australis TaxID=1536484 RepID=A0AAN6X1D3_9PEZI|nr:hypothetical protein QBC35DRAFT_459674 [Podospora australis]